MVLNTRLKGKEVGGVGGWREKQLGHRLEAAVVVFKVHMRPVGDRQPAQGRPKYVLIWDGH